VESLTNTMEERILKIIAVIDEMGGIVNAVERGWMHDEISTAASEYQAAIESGDMPLVGVNRYRIEDEELPVELFSSPETRERQIEKLTKIKAERSDSEVQKALDAIKRCCEEDRNLMEVNVDAVQAYVTEGEITKTLKSHYGVWDPPLF
jgi:methylmalonyl-CoA mutase N-terminal domain/subunit